MKNVKDNRKEELKTLLKKYVVNGVIDISKFRMENKKEYNLISHYFGSVDDACAEIGAIRLPSRGMNGSATLINKLALSLLNEMRAHGITYEEIAKQYGVSRSCVSQLQKALQEKIK